MITKLTPSGHDFSSHEPEIVAKAMAAGSRLCHRARDNDHRFDDQAGWPSISEDVDALADALTDLGQRIRAELLLGGISESERCARICEYFADMLEAGAGPIDEPAYRLRQAARSMRNGATLTPSGMLAAEMSREEDAKEGQGSSSTERYWWLAESFRDRFPFPEKIQWLHGDTETLAEYLDRAYRDGLGEREEATPEMPEEAILLLAQEWAEKHIPRGPGGLPHKTHAIVGFELAELLVVVRRWASAAPVEEEHGTVMSHPGTVHHEACENVERGELHLCAETGCPTALHVNWERTARRRGQIGSMWKKRAEEAEATISRTGADPTLAAKHLVMRKLLAKAADALEEVASTSDLRSQIDAILDGASLSLSPKIEAMLRSPAATLAEPEGPLAGAPEAHARCTKNTTGPSRLPSGGMTSGRCAKDEGHPPPCGWGSGGEDPHCVCPGYVKQVKPMVHRDFCPERPEAKRRRERGSIRGVEAGVAQKVRERSGESTPETAPAAVQAVVEQRSCKPEVPGSIPGSSLDSTSATDVEVDEGGPVDRQLSRLDDVMRDIRSSMRSALKASASSRPGEPTVASVRRDLGVLWEQHLRVPNPPGALVRDRISKAQQCMDRIAVAMKGEVLPSAEPKESP